MIVDDTNKMAIIWKVSFARVPWSGERTSFCAHRNITRRDQLTASCGCQTIHRRDHWYRALTNGPHQLRTGLEHVLVGFGIRSRLNVPMIFFYTNTKRSSYGNGIKRYEPVPSDCARRRISFLARPSIRLTEGPCCLHLSWSLSPKFSTSPTIGSCAKKNRSNRWFWPEIKLTSKLIL